MDDLLVLRGVLAPECIECLEQGMSAWLRCHPAHPACIERHGGLPAGMPLLDGSSPTETILAFPPALASLLYFFKVTFKTEQEKAARTLIELTEKSVTCVAGHPGQLLTYCQTLV